MIKVIGLTGYAGCGKSTIAHYLCEYHGFVNGKFAHGLKEMLRAYLRYRRVDEATIARMMEEDLKEVPTPKLNGRSPRYAMQKIGDEWGRQLIHPDLWVDTEMDAIADLPRVVFDDVRYPNEAAAILKVGGFMVRVSNPRNKLNVGQHESEAHVDEFVCDAHIINDGTINDLYRHAYWRLVIGESVPPEFELRRAA